MPAQPTQTEEIDRRDAKNVEERFIFGHPTRSLPAGLTSPERSFPLDKPLCMVYHNQYESKAVYHVKQYRADGSVEEIKI